MCVHVCMHMYMYMYMYIYTHTYWGRGGGGMAIGGFLGPGGPQIRRTPPDATRRQAAGRRFAALVRCFGRAAPKPSLRWYFSTSNCIGEWGMAAKTMTAKPFVCFLDFSRGASMRAPRSKKKSGS